MSMPATVNSKRLVNTCSFLAVLWFCGVSLHCTAQISLKGKVGVGSSKAWNPQKIKMGRVKAESGRSRKGSEVLAQGFFSSWFYNKCFKKSYGWNTFGCKVLKMMLVAGIPVSQVPDKLMAHKQQLVLTFHKAKMWASVWMLRASSAIHKNINVGDA